MILNLGTVFFVFLILLTIPVLLMCTRPCKFCCKKRCKNWESKHSSISDSFRGNVYFKFIFEGLLDISICAYLNFIWMNDNGEGFRWDTVFHTFNSGCLIVLTIAILLFPILVITFYLCNFSKWKSDDFKDRYGTLLEGLHKKSRWSLGYPVIFMLRRYVLIFVVTVTSEYLWLQITTLVFFSALQAGYLTTFQPSK
mmetsp:Transcript_38/g.63  ORF Transcript_38/g.63 Transcript_38/m.63 type:complete len:197 (+) Transcript_38:1189-1779(+)